MDFDFPLENVSTPTDYYAGIGPSPIGVPNNLLVFYRSNSDHLIKNYPPSHHHRFVLIVNLGGSGTVVVDDLTLRFTPNQGLLVFPYQFHHYSHFDNARLRWLFITFDLPETESLASLRYRQIPLDETTLQRCGEICKIWSESSKDSGVTGETLMLCGSILCRALRQIGDQPKRTTPKRGRELISKVAAFFEHHIEEPFRIADVADELAISESHLRQQFRNHYGMSLGRYFRRLRVTRAAQLLDSTDRNVSEIAAACGFESIFAFSRTFKTMIGKSPTEYRR